METEGYTIHACLTGGYVTETLGTCDGGPFSHDPQVPHVKSSLCDKWIPVGKEPREPYPEHECEGCKQNKPRVVSPAGFGERSACHSPEGWVCMKYVPPRAYNYYLHKNRTKFLESEEFYNLMQAYRFSNVADQVNVVATFEAVKQYIREQFKV